MSERSVFLSALEIDDPERRAAYLREACGADAGLRRSVEELLQANASAGSFMDTPAATIDPTAFGTAVGDDAPVTFLAPSDQPGSLGRLGNYEITRVIGRGGMGIVLEGRDTRLERVVAVKVLAPQLAVTAAARQRFSREAKAAAAVRDEHVVTIYAVDEAEGLPYLVMEFIAGLSLQERIDRDGPLELREILRIGIQTARGLAAAHSHGLIHRDVKPANILLENGVERVKLTDFGLARVVDDASITQSGVIAGTPQYMAPEQAKGEAVDRPADLFSLGSVLYAMCTGRPPFRAGTTLGVLKRVCEDPLSPIREINPSIPDWLVALIEKLHAKTPNERYQSAAEVADLLSEQLAQLQHPAFLEGLEKNSSHSRIQNSKSTIHFRRWALAAAILLSLALGLGLAEATGTTQLAATVIRIFTPSGTLVVETNDPAVKVTIEGDGGLILTGAGLEEIRLRPGSYKVLADKDGKPIPLERELISIARGGREVVKVKLEPPPAPATVKAEKGAFVQLASGLERKFDTLAEAVLAAIDGDTIEVRGNGPFVSDGVTIQHPLVIRAGPGFRPIIRLSAFAEGQPDLLTTNVPLVLEGLELQRGSSGDSGTASAIIGINEGSLYISNCRLITGVKGAHIQARGVLANCEVRNCELITGLGPSVVRNFTEGRLVLDNCVMAGGGVFSCAYRSRPHKRSFRLSRSTLVSSTVLTFTVNDPKTALEAKTDFDPILLDLSQDVIAGPDSIWLGGGVKSLFPLEEEAALVSRLPSWFARQEQGNLYADNHRFLARHPKKLEEWNQFWGLADTGSQQGVVRFRGGDLVAKRNAGAELQLDDFRLRADSAGYRAGADGKDLGADVDLVGPGRAYERWKKTPEYQEWLKDTDQLKDRAAAKPEGGTFVLQGGTGVAERKFDTLADAVLGASDGDTIEIRGNGPFVSEPINIQRTILTIRAGDGFRPVIKLGSEAVTRDVPLLATSAPLVLEGLELTRTAPEDPVNGRYALIKAHQAPLRAANCRFSAVVYPIHSPVCMFRNCEFLAAGGVSGQACSGARLVLENCLRHWKTFPLSVRYEDDALEDMLIEIKRCTFLSDYTPLQVELRGHLPVPSDGPQASNPIRFEVSDTIVDALAVLRFHEKGEFLEKAAVPPPTEAEASLQRLLQWRGKRNLFTAGSTSIKWAVDGTGQPPHGPKTLEEWTQFWGGAEADSLEGRIRFQGGGLVSRSNANLDQLKPLDFRLRPDSAGYRAGPDGKDLGADVDLVGPGRAYERWKKTPEYQEWLKETGQKK